MRSVMECERSVITMTLLQLDYLVYGLGNCVDDISTQTGLIISCWSLQTHACLVKSTGAQPKTTFNFKCVFILELKRDAYITFEEKQSAYPQKRKQSACQASIDPVWFPLVFLSARKARKESHMHGVLNEVYLQNLFRDEYNFSR